jgi:hypothetical protein
MTNLLRLRCPHCRRYVGVNLTGLYRKHRTRLGLTCTASGTPAS